jgi:hypothetical protein
LIAAGVRLFACVLCLHQSAGYLQSCHSAMAAKPPYIALMLRVMYYFEWWKSTAGTERAAADRQ